jgi:hypothetical protein
MDVTNEPPEHPLPLTFTNGAHIDERARRKFAAKEKSYVESKS